MPAFTVNDPALPPSLHGPVLVDGSGRLRFWAAVASFESHGDLTPSTVAMRLSAIERLYVYAEGLWPRDSLDAIIARAPSPEADGRMWWRCTVCETTFTFDRSCPGSGGGSRSRGT
jgi:hypothetical protein